MRTAILALVIAAVPDVAVAQPCPVWRERQAMDCMRGYLRVDPAAFVLVGEERPGAGFGTSLGVFRGRDTFAAAFGVRAGYDTDYRGAGWGFDRTIHAGPELRLGAMTPRAFGYMLARAGYTRRLDAGRARFDFGGAQGGFHYGLGVGVWGRIDRRFLLGAEGALDIIQFPGKGAVPTLFLSLTLGAWL